MSEFEKKASGSSGPTDEVYFEEIRSPFVLSNVIESLNLNIAWGEKYGGGNPLKTAKAIKLLQRRMRLEAGQDAGLITISVDSEDPNEAAKIANAIAKAYHDYRSKTFVTTITGSIRALEDEYRKQGQDIKAKQENLVQLGKQLNLPNPEPADELLKTNYPTYFQAKQELQKMIDLHKQINYRIETYKIDLAIPRTATVQITDIAQPPEFPVGPNRWLGAALLVVGLFSTIGGLFLLESSRQQSA
jgi:uncharacterized protein involved in exopolysaccharide biosynthesis